MELSEKQSALVKEFETAVNTKDYIKAITICDAALREQKENEFFNAAFVQALCEQRIPCFEQIRNFLEIYPNSLYPVRVYLAEVLCSDGAFDDCVSEARYFIRLVWDHYHNDFNNVDHKRTKEFLLKAFILACTVYIAAGARTHAKKILMYAREYATSGWQQHYDMELVKLTEELKDETLQAIDAKWEAFFNNGLHYMELYQSCAEKGYTELAIRLRLLKQKFDNESDFKIDMNTFMLVVLTEDKTSYFLG